MDFEIGLLPEIRCIFSHAYIGVSESIWTANESIFWKLFDMEVEKTLLRHSPIPPSSLKKYDSLPTVTYDLQRNIVLRPVLESDQPFDKGAVIDGDCSKVDAAVASNTNISYSASTIHTDITNSQEVTFKTLYPYRWRLFIQNPLS